MGKILLVGVLAALAFSYFGPMGVVAVGVLLALKKTTD